MISPQKKLPERRRAHGVDRSDLMSSRSRSVSGAALVVVLALLVIILGLVVTFLSRAALERSASSGYAAASTTRTLSDSAVNLVQAQIRHATTQGGSVAWASQPGMIRTFSDLSDGAMINAYKLYSAEKLILEKPSAAELSADIPPTTWATDKAIWSDLNSPVLVDGLANYPILDPNAIGEVEGFSIVNAPTLGTSNLAPMPVRWLYVLQSGAIVAPAGGGDGASIPGASKQDPIVGRIAFWTDDDTSKININTASEGTFWDTPRVNSFGDRKLAEFQPAQKEFQRYPGHPSTTSLAPVLLAKNGVTSEVLTKPERDALYALSPRIVGGGSDAGSVVYTSGNPLPLDSDRLYASVDELIFSAGRGDQEASLGLDAAKLERAKFFLSATSRAPEVTLFNTPRVAAWPIDKTDTIFNRSTFDRLIAFCSTVNGRPYYFTRDDPKSASKDYEESVRNKQLYAYLQALTSRNIPGFGGSLGTKYPTAPNGSERDQILTEMFDYIRAMNLNDPLVVNNFYKRGQYGALMGAGQVTPIRIGNTQGFGRFPMLTEVGIQFICTADGRHDPVDPVSGVVTNNAWSTSNVLENRSLVSLLLPGQRRVEAMLLFEAFVPTMGWPPIHPSFTLRVKGLDTLAVTNNLVEGSLFPASRLPVAGLVGSSRNIPPGNLDGGRSYGGSISPRWMTAYGKSPARLGGAIPADSHSVNNPIADPLPEYPFISDPVTVDASTGSMTFASDVITIEVFPGQVADVSQMTPVYTLQLKIDPTTVPIPQLINTNVSLSGSASPLARESFWTFSAVGWNSLAPTVRGRLDRANMAAGQASTLGMGAPFLPQDVVRTWVPAHSDFRLLGGANSTETTVFSPIGSTAGTPMSHSFGESGRGAHFLGYQPQGWSSGFNKGLANVSYNIWGVPDVAIYSSASQSGDWDNGVALGVDGPYINKSDEGNRAPLGTSNIPYYSSEERYESSGMGQFSPNRQMPSAGMFGSLSTGLKSGQPYQTLLFRPQPSHPQSAQSRPGQPADYLWTDLFWMPVVEPYAISEPFSTAGKINMNYEIMPFSYIKRATGMYALMRSERMLAINGNAGKNYKVGWESPITENRSAIDIPQTLYQFDSKFEKDKDVFRSPAQICDIYLVPKGQSWITSASFNQATVDVNAANYWKTYSLTGDSTRERPYTNLLGRLTTKSNVYTVHYRVQALRQSPTSTPGAWDEQVDKVVGEFRGSTTIERYISPSDPIPDYASVSDPLSLPDLGGFYKWRVLSSRQFAP